MKPPAAPLRLLASRLVGRGRVARLAVAIAAAAGPSLLGLGAARAESDGRAEKRPPVRLDFVQYGAAFTVAALLSPGDVCPGGDSAAPCILGSGGGLALRGGYRAPEHWYIGGAYEFTKMDSSNLYSLAIFQQLRLEGRYYLETGTLLLPFFPCSIGAVGYGNQWGIDVVGAAASAGVGLEVEFSRMAVVSTSVLYRPVMLAAWRDTAGQERPLGVAHMLGIELSLEIRAELPKR